MSATEHTVGDAAIVEVYPTKDLFISMLVKDITLIPAIEDLVDNSVDGARVFRRDADFTDLTIRIEITRDHFKITDNCGGIPIDVARHYAFRFGRDASSPVTHHSIGQFGVGMKRALFKLGSNFVVESTAAASYFKLTVDVEAWRRRADWNFRFDDFDESAAHSDENRQTTITVTQLHDQIKAAFASDSFPAAVLRSLEESHRESLTNGLVITVNHVPATVAPLTILASEELKPAFFEGIIEEPGEANVYYKIYVGLSQKDSEEAGWYIFCNGRLIVGGEQTNVTGWGEGRGKTIPKYHGEFSRFRGYVFFDSDNPRLLPWNTMKTGLEVDSPRYQAVRQKMVLMMRPVINFLNRISTEVGRVGESGPLQEKITSADEVRLRDVEPRDTFLPPKMDAPDPVLKPVRITYTRPAEQYEQVKRALQVKKPREVGEATFDYYYTMEIE
jgi:hypothetical protein